MTNEEFLNNLRIRIKAALKRYDLNARVEDWRGALLIKVFNSTMPDNFKCLINAVVAIRDDDIVTFEVFINYLGNCQANVGSMRRVYERGFQKNISFRYENEIVSEIQTTIEKLVDGYKII